MMCQLFLVTRVRVLEVDTCVTGVDSGCYVGVKVKMQDLFGGKIQLSRFYYYLLMGGSFVKF